METKNKVYIGLSVLFLLIAFEIGRYTKATRVEIVTKEVIKEVIKKDSNVDIKKNKVITITKTVNVDGSITTNTVITDRGTVESHTTTDSIKESVKTSDTTTLRDSGLTVEALSLIDYKNLSNDKIYGFSVSKRILGNLRAGILGTTDKKIGFTVGIDF